MWSMTQEVWYTHLSSCLIIWAHESPRCLLVSWKRWVADAIAWSPHAINHTRTCKRPCSGIHIVFVYLSKTALLASPALCFAWISLEPSLRHIHVTWTCRYFEKWLPVPDTNGLKTVAGYFFGIFAHRVDAQWFWASTLWRNDHD